MREENDCPYEILCIFFNPVTKTYENCSLETFGQLIKKIHTTFSDTPRMLAHLVIISNIVTIRASYHYFTFYVPRISTSVFSEKLLELGKTGITVHFPIFEFSGHVLETDSLDAIYRKIIAIAHDYSNHNAKKPSPPICFFGILKEATVGKQKESSFFKGQQQISLKPLAFAEQLIGKALSKTLPVTVILDLVPPNLLTVIIQVETTFLRQKWQLEPLVANAPVTTAPQHYEEKVFPSEIKTIHNLYGAINIVIQKFLLLNTAQENNTDTETSYPPTSPPKFDI